MSRVRAGEVRRRMADLDPVTDGAELSRLSLVVLHGHRRLVYALFTVAFLQQVATPTMARILYRRGTGDIVRATRQRNDDTIVFFGQLLDHGPDSEVGIAWIDRLNRIHAHFPLRDEDSLYTLATLALGPHRLTEAVGASPFDPGERTAHWHFWRRVAERQRIPDLPDSAAELARWARSYEQREQRSSPEGRAIADALVAAFGEECLPAVVRPLAGRLISLLCPTALREIHDLPAPGTLLGWAGAVSARAYAALGDHLPVDPDRSLVEVFGTSRHGTRGPDEVGYVRRNPADGVGT